MTLEVKFNEESLHLRIGTPTGYHPMLVCSDLKLEGRMYILNNSYDKILTCTSGKEIPI